MQLEKKFNTNFSVKGWAILYFVAMGFNLAFNIASKPLLNMFEHSYMMMIIISHVLPIAQMLIVLIFSSIAYAKAILFFINTLSLDDNKFVVKMEENSFVTFVLSNIVICIVTLGIYIPWAYKAIVDKIVTNTEYAKGGRFSFRSKASKLFSYLIISCGSALLIAFLFIGAISIFMINEYKGAKVMPFLFLKGVGTFLLTIFSSFVVTFFIIILLIAIVQVLIFKWFCNLSYTSQAKNRLYVMDINMKDAIFFTLGQIFLLCITIGFYSGAYMLNIYTYFSRYIVEKDGDKNTGALVFKKPADKGAGYLLLQVVLSIITVGFYTPFAWASFINNTYLSTEEDEKGDSGRGDAILIGSNDGSVKDNKENIESSSNNANTGE